MMKYSRIVFLLLMACSVTNLYADLVNIEDDVFIASYSDADNVVIALDVNPITSEYVVCFARFAVVSDDIRCKRFDADDNELANIFLDSSTTDTLFDFDSIDVALNDSGEVYIMWTGADQLNISEADFRAFVQGFDSSGDALFDPVETSNTDWLQASFALSPSNFWIVGALQSDGEMKIAAEYFSTDGVTGSEITIQDGLFDAGSSCDELVDVASNRSGDLVISWVEPNATTGTCSGSIFAQTYRETGDAISDSIQLSDSLEDDNGDDASNYLDPVSTAYENGEYVIAWTDDSDVYVAKLSLDGSIASSQEDILSGASPKIGGNSANQDYVVLSEIDSGSSCTLSARLAFDADTDPDVTFSAGDCGFNHAIEFQADGKMILAGTTTDTSAGDVVINRIDLPAEIEVSSVSVLEGDPQRGISNVAVIDVSLTRAHPAGDDIEVSYFTRDSTALVGIDYTLAQGSLTFPGDSGSLSQTILVSIIPDSEFEDDEIFEINLESPINAVLKNSGDEADITILDDDSTPDITADCTDGNANNCREVDEPGVAGTSTDVIITLTMAAAVDSDITVNFSTSDGTATAGEDYLANSGSLQFSAGSTEAGISVTILGDDVNEDTETFDIVLSASDTISLPETTLTISIINENLCSLSLEPVPNEVVVLAAGGTETFEVVSSLSTCDWDIASDVDWITLSSPATGSGTGDATVIFDVEAFDPASSEPQSRNGNITVTLDDPLVTQDPLVFEVGQDGDCDFTLDTSSASFAVDGGSGSFTVTPSDETCEWSGTSDVDWVTVDSPVDPFAGTGTLEYTVSDNAGDTNVENDARSFTLISEEFDFTISQDGCSYDLDQTSIDVDAADSTASVNVLAPTSASGECAWTAVSNSSWILISDGSSGSGGGTVSLAILDNASVEARVGSVTIGDETLSVNQSGQDCDYSVDPASFSICPDGDTFEIDVTATDGCSWSLAEQDDWLETLTNATGIGSETASGVVLSNLSEADRSSSIELQASTRGTSVATIDFSQDGFLIYEPFESGLPSDWLFDPDGDWAVTGGSLVGDLFANGTGTALDMSTACDDCKIESTVTVTTASNGSMDVLTLIGWYISETNYVGLAMDEFTNNWRLLQVFGGSTTAVETNIGPIVPNTSYDVGLGYNGTSFFAEVDGAEILQLEARFTNPVGYAGFMLNDNSGVFTELRVIGSSAETEILFIDQFEAASTSRLGDGAGLSVCTQ